ncbi:MAG: hypothetical protein ACI4R6_01355 [Lachnospiraceae bacterium]
MCKTFLITPSEHERFTAVCDAVIHSEHERNGIGTLSEKTIHSILKNYLEPDTSFHEIRTDRYVADIRTPEGIYEIQTRQFNKLRGKLDSFLNEYPVTVVYPIAHTKYLRWIDSETGEISAPHKSPKRGVFQEVFYELYKIKPYLTHPNFHLLLMLIDLEEYRFLNGWSKDKKRGSSRSDRIPTALYAQEAIMSPSDYMKLIPDTVPPRFTVKDYAKACHITQTVAQPAMNVLCHVGVIEHVGKVRNAYLYERCTSKSVT